MKNIDKEDFDIYKALLPYCKKTLPQSSDQPRQIDFLLLEADLESFHDAQRRVCEQIVNVVDKHLEEFYDISSKMHSIQGLLSSTDQLYTNLAMRVDDTRTTLLQEQLVLKTSLESYEIRQLEASLMEETREALQFLVRFNQRFEQIKEANYDKLAKRDQNLLIKFSYKLGYMRRILGHHLVRKHLKHCDETDPLQSLESEFETYISEQLIRLVKSDESHLEGCNIKLCYQYLSKQDMYYQIVEQHLVWNELRVVEAELLTNKTSIISTKDPSHLDSFFKNLFLLVGQLPKGFPKKRLVILLKSFLGKKQFNFMYTYTLPVFPTAFNCFCENIHYLGDDWVQRELIKTHKWNVKMWADVKSQEILRKSLNQDLTKWLDITFKKENLLEGVKSKTIKTALLLIGRYCLEIRTVKCTEANYPVTLSTLVDNRHNLSLRLEAHLGQVGIQQHVVKQIVQSVQSKLESALQEFLCKNLEMVVANTVNSLCNTNSFLNKVLHGNQSQAVHSPAIVYKSLNAHLRNYPQLSSQAQTSIRGFVIKQLQLKYDKLRQEMVEYCAGNLTEDQRVRTLAAVDKDKLKLFQE